MKRLVAIGLTLFNCGFSILDFGFANTRLAVQSKIENPKSTMAVVFAIQTLSLPNATSQLTMSEGKTIVAQSAASIASALGRVQTHANEHGVPTLAGLFIKHVSGILHTLRLFAEGKVGTENLHYAQAPIAKARQLLTQFKSRQAMRALVQRQWDPEAGITQKEILTFQTALNVLLEKSAIDIDGVRNAIHTLDGSLGELDRILLSLQTALKDAPPEPAAEIHYGPVQPSDELSLRQDGDGRVAMIAGLSMRHNSTSGADFIDIFYTLNDLLLIVKDYPWAPRGIPAFKRRLEAAQELYDQILEMCEREVVAKNVENRLGKLSRALATIEQDYEKMHLDPKPLKTQLGHLRELGEHMKRFMNFLSKDLPALSAFARDRYDFALARAQNSAGGSSVLNVLKGFEERYSKTLLIERSALQKSTSVDLSEARLFSLLNNLIVHAHRNRIRELVVLKAQTLEKAGRVRFTLTDDGEGFKPDDFEGSPLASARPRFAEMKPQSDRMHVGLAEVWDTVAIHKGTIEIYTRPGTTWIIELPTSNQNVSAETQITTTKKASKVAKKLRGAA